MNARISGPHLWLTAQGGGAGTLLSLHQEKGYKSERTMKHSTNNYIETKEKPHYRAYKIKNLATKMQKPVRFFLINK